MNIIQSLWSGRKSLANGATLANSCLGITPRNERLANIPHPVVQQNLDIALNEYNKLLLSMNNGDSSILHLLTSERELDGDVYFEYGMYWRHFDEYNYNDRNIWIEKEDLKNIFEVKDDECYILKDKDTTKEIKELLRKRAPEFPPSVLANLATHNIRDTAYKYVIELYDKSPGCGVEVELTVSKPALKSNYSSFYIQSEYYNFPCDHVNGIQKQSIQSMHNEHLKYVGCTNHMITGTSIEKNNAFSEVYHRFGKQQLKSLKKPSVAQYCTMAANNKESMRRAFVIRLNDSIGRECYKQYQDSTEFDGISKKDKKHRKMDTKNTYYSVAKDIQSFYSNTKCKSYAECHRRLINEIDYNDFGVKDIQNIFFNEDDRNQYNLVAKLCKMERISQPDQQTADLLSKWLKEYKNDKQHND